ncbi:hypothetical protein OAN22_00080 [Alphaproteobacteria bacterium]|nr:hypothetical protein [Alphaproteobacteria bacterium]
MLKNIFLALFMSTITANLMAAGSIQTLFNQCKGFVGPIDHTFDAREHLAREKCAENDPRIGEELGARNIFGQVSRSPGIFLVPFSKARQYAPYSGFTPNSYAEAMCMQVGLAGIVLVKDEILQAAEKALTQEEVNDRIKEMDRAHRQGNPYRYVFLDSETYQEAVHEIAQCDETLLKKMAIEAMDMTGQEGADMLAFLYEALPVRMKDFTMDDLMIFPADPSMNLIVAIFQKYQQIEN